MVFAGLQAEEGLNKTIKSLRSPGNPNAPHTRLAAHGMERRRQKQSAWVEKTLARTTRTNPFARTPPRDANPKQPPQRTDPPRSAPEPPKGTATRGRGHMISLGETVPRGGAPKISPLREIVSPRGRAKNNPLQRLFPGRARQEQSTEEIVICLFLRPTSHHRNEEN